MRCTRVCSRGCWTIGVLALGLALGGPAPGAAPLVADVQIVGARRIPEQRVLNEITVRKGQPYDQHAVWESVRKLELTQWYALVQARESSTPDGVVVTFQVVERPIVHEVIYEGAKHLDRDELDALTGLKRGSPMSPSWNWKARAAIEKRYHDMGRLLATVELAEGGRSEDTRVRFVITEGPIVRIRDIRFEGNQFVSDSRLKTQIQADDGILGVLSGQGKYRPELLDHDLAKLLEYYRTYGFFSAKISRKIEWNPGHRSVDVVFVIDEGPRFTVAGYEVAGNKTLDDSILLANNRLRAGEPYNGQVMQASLREMQAEYGQRGYYNTRVVPEPVFAPDRPEVTMVYRVIEGRPSYVGEIFIVGNTVTRDRVIRRQLAFAGLLPGQLLDTQALEASRRNLARLHIFKVQPEAGIVPTVEIIDPDVWDEFKDILVQVEEDRTGTFQFGVGISSDQGANASIVLHERNFDITRVPTSFDDVLNGRAFRGAGQEFRLELVPGNEYSRYAVSWREPYFLDSPYSLGTSAYYYTRRFEEYDERRTGGRISISRRLTPFWSASVSTRIEDVKVDDFAPFAPADFHAVAGHNFLLAPRFALIYDSRDSILRPTEGSKLEFAYEQGFGDFTFPVFTIEGSRYFTLWERPDGSGRHIFALRGQVGFAGDDTPLFERFWLGGFRTLRGFDFRGVSPLRDGFRVGGTFMTVGTVEYQFPILASDRLYGVVFSDFGTVEDDVAIRDFRVSAGAGVRIIVPMFGPVPIAIDWAYPIVRGPGDERESLSFSVGVQF